MRDIGPNNHKSPNDPVSPTPKCAAFLEHWKSLRRDAAVPRLPDFFDAANFSLQPWLVIIDVDENDTQPTRLVGTGIVEFFRVDPTGMDFLRTTTSEVRPIFQHCHQMIHQVPCGKMHDSVCSTSKGREVVVIAICLPLLRRNGGRCAAWLLDVGTTLDYGEVGSEVRRIARETWVDVGHGIPA